MRNTQLTLAETVKRQRMMRELYYSKERMKGRLRTDRHPDFSKLYEDFQKVRNGVPAQVLYKRFIEAYELDDTKPYDVGHQKRLQALAMRSSLHLSLKREYPEINWDLLITGEGKPPTPVKVRRAPKKRGMIVELDDTDIPYIDSIVIGKKVVIFE